MKRILELVFAAGGALCVWAAPRAAHAQQNQGFSLDRFDPAERGSDWFAADSLDLRGHGRLILGATADWAEKPLVLYAPNGDEQTALIEHQLFVHVGAAVLLADRLRLGLNLPLALYQSGNSVNLNGTSFGSSNATTIGDLRLSADLRLLGEYRGAAELSLGVAGYLPTGSKAAFTGDGKARVAPRLMLAGELGPFMYAARAGFSYRANDSGFAGAATGSEVFVTGAAGLRVADGRLVIGPELYGSTNVTSGDSFFARRTSPFEVLFGAHYMPVDGLRIGAGIGPGLTRGIGAPQFRGLLALEWAPPVEKERAIEPSDRDHDGVLDDADACPDVAGVVTDDPTTNGCPPPRDRDKDGILDAEDACPDEPGIKTDDPRSNGCPPPKDRDKDGVLDDVDACPDDAGVATEDAKTNGCPPPRDRDKDGIVDDQDACPDAPGPANANPKKNGCPEARIEQGQIKILERVEFENASSKIRPVSETVLNAVLEIMKTHPEFTKLGVEGHTDNHGGAAYNKRLSEQRAVAVVNWLVSHGLERKRLSAQGFGPDKPIDTNDTDEGRQNNRRVEFHILEGDSGAVETQ
jgi:outer membrane protein OmpA-like peptidoglycan-associated protein